MADIYIVRGLDKRIDTLRKLRWECPTGIHNMDTDGCSLCEGTDRIVEELTNLKKNAKVLSDGDINIVARFVRDFPVGLYKHIGRDREKAKEIIEKLKGD